MVLATLGGIPLHTNPTDIRWNFSMKTAETRTMGGRVVQVLGTTLSDLTLQGTFGNGRKDLGDEEGWQQQVRFRRQVRRWANAAQNAQHARPLKFTYPPRQWDFNVYIKAFSDVHMEVTEFNPRWQLVLFPVDNGAASVVAGIKDLYIKRLMIGVGWKQTAYNGPTQSEVDETLSGRTVEQYLEDRFQQAFEAPNGNLADDGTTG